MKKIEVIELFAGVGGFRLGIEKNNDKNFKFNTIWNNQWEPSRKVQHASDIYKKRFGEKGHFNKDISEIEAYKIPQHNLLCGGFPCFIAGHKVSTNKDYVEIQNIKVGDYVLTHNNRYRKVLKTMNQKIDFLSKIKIYGIPEISCTENHPYYCLEKKTIIKKVKNEMNKTINKSFYEFSKPKWIEAKDLKPLDHYVGINVNKIEEYIKFDINDISTLYNINLLKTKTLPFDLNEFYWFLGRYLADGWYQEDKRTDRKNSIDNKVFLCCSKKETNILESKLKKINLHYVKKEERTVFKYIFSNVLLMEYLKKFGKYTYGKKIPLEIQNLPIKFLKHFIEGYRSGNENISTRENNLHKITTVSEDLAYGFQNIIHKVYKLPCQINKYIRPKTCVIESRTVNQRDTYTLTYRLESERMIIPFLYDKIWVPVRKIKNNILIDTTVFNIEIEEDNSYTIQNLIVHNCQDYSIASVNAKGMIGKKGVLWWEIHRIIKEHKTPYLILENVDRVIISPEKQKGKDFSIILKSLIELDYIVEWRIINAAEYGMPQKRKRTYFLIYKKDSKLGREYLKRKSDFISNMLLNEEFKIKNDYSVEDIVETDLSENILDISNDFNKNNSMSVRPYYNAGIAFGNKAYSVKINADYNGEYKVLKDVLLDEKNIPLEFYIDKTNMKKWEDFKFAKKTPRTNKKTGHSYMYVQGNMSFPDDINKPSRTIITSEGSRSASRTTHAVDIGGNLRRLHPVELERLNGFPDNHTLGVSNPMRGFLMGNALIVKVVQKISNLIKKYEI